MATLVKFIEQQREEKRERWPTLQLEYKEDRPSPDEAKRGLQMISKRLAEAEQKAAEEQRTANQERKAKEEERKAKLKEQIQVVLKKGT